MAVPRHLKLTNGSELHYLEYGSAITPDKIEYHSIDGPARYWVYHDGTSVTEYYVNGRRHRDGDKPAYIKEDVRGVTTEFYYVNDQLHRENGPAIVTRMGDVIHESHYFINGKLHREDGPAINVNKPSGTSFWQFSDLYTYATDGRPFVHETLDAPFYAYALSGYPCSAEVFVKLVGHANERANDIVVEDRLTRTGVLLDVNVTTIPPTVYDDFYNPLR